MVTNEENIKKLYKDAMYLHLIREGESINSAKIKIKSLFEN